MKILHYKTKKSFSTPLNWREWLKEQGWQLVNIQPIKEFAFEVFINRSEYALYHPKVYFGNTECLYIGIPSLEELNELLFIATQMLQVLAGMQQVRQGDLTNVVVVTPENQDAVIQDIADRLFPPDETE